MNALLMLGCLITGVEDGDSVTPPHDYRQVSKNPNVVQVAFLQLPVEYLPDQENHSSIWQKTSKPNPEKID